MLRGFLCICTFGKIVLTVLDDSSIGFVPKIFTLVHWWSGNVLRELVYD